MVALFIGIKKVFDCIQNSILISELYKMGIWGIPNQWFNSYFTGQKQIVVVNGALSASLNIL